MIRDIDYLVTDVDEAPLRNANLDIEGNTIQSIGPDVPDDLKAVDGARIGADFEIVSIGSATRSGPRSIRIPLVLGNPEGESITLALKLEIEPLLEDGEG